jgi:hypothetical protein
MLNELEINCNYSKNGCKEYIKLGELLGHTNKCSFNPELRILCDCGLVVDTKNLIEHQNSCIDYLKNQLNKSLDRINSLNAKNAELEKELKESSILTEWQTVRQFIKIATNMSEGMENKIIEKLTQTLNEGVFNAVELSEQFREEFGGNWTLFVGNKLLFNNFEYSNILGLKIGNFNVFIWMNIKPVNDVLALEKQLKILNIGIENNTWNNDMLNTWELFYNLTDDSLNISERLLDKNIIEYFLKFNKLFPYNEQNLFNPMVGVFANISEFTELRYRLMKPELIETFLKMLSNKNKLISYLSCQMLANILSEGEVFWKQYMKQNKVLNRNSVIDRLRFEMNGWRFSQNELHVSFITFKPFNRLLKCNEKIPQVVHYFAVWTLAHFTQKESQRYCLLLKEDGCLTLLENLIKCSKTEEYVRSLAKYVLYLNELFIKHGSLGESLNFDVIDGKWFEK